jgi:hypothetical protein
MRVDVPHLRAMESAASAEFDILAGRMVAGSAALVLSGFQLDMNGAVGSPATSLTVLVADGLVLHRRASEAGTVFWVPGDRQAEQLGGSNPRLTGSFVPNRTNFVGLDLSRATVSVSSDLVMFANPDDVTTEIPKTIPTARVLDYRLVVSTAGFGGQPNVLPIAIVTTDSSNLVTEVQDARQLMFRLGSGGDAPSAVHSYPWPGTRAENTTGDVFSGGDKAIGALKPWMDAVMTRLWEIGGGERWYSAAADRNVAMFWTGTSFSNGENFEWDGTNLHWKGLRFLFDNSTGALNDVADQTSDSPGLTDLADGECLYVDLDRSQDLTGGSALVAAKSALTTVGPGVQPGSRQIFAWRSGSEIYTKNSHLAVGGFVSPASTTSLGIVKLNQTPGSSSDPVVVSIMANGQVQVTATGGNSFAAQFTGNGSGPGSKNIGGATGSGAENVAGGGNTPGTISEATGSGKSYQARGSSSTVLGFLHADTSGTQVQIGSSTNHALRLAVNNGNVWEITTGGALQAVGGNRQISNVADPSAAQDAATKTYVDARTAGGVLLFAASQAGTTTGDKFLPIGAPYTSELSAEALGQIPVPFSGTVKNLHVQYENGSTVSTNRTFTVRQNGVDSSLTCVVSSATGSDTTHSFSVSAGDLISVKVVGAGANGNTGHWVCTMELAKP